MEDFIRDLVASATKPIRTLVDSVRSRLAAIYGAFVDAFKRVRDAFGRWVEKGRAWAAAQARHALATANRLRWLLTVEIPRRLGRLATDIQAWTRERLAEAVTAARTLLTELKNWAAARIADALTALTALRDWATRKLSEVWADLTRVRDTVANLLGTPERLARWAAGAMLGALVDIVIRDADRWADYVIRHRRDLEVRAIALTERILDRIM